MPATGTQGIAQVPGISPATSGTCTCKRPMMHRIDVVEHHAAIFAVVFHRLAHAGTRGVIETKPLRVKLKALFDTRRA